MGKLRGAFRSRDVGMTKEQIREILARDHEIDISILESIAATVSRVEVIERVNDCIRYVSLV